MGLYILLQRMTNIVKAQPLIKILYCFNKFIRNSYEVYEYRGDIASVVMHANA